MRSLKRDLDSILLDNEKLMKLHYALSKIKEWTALNDYSEVFEVKVDKNISNDELTLLENTYPYINILYDKCR